MKKNNVELQTRREFFKGAVTKVIPIIAGMTIACTPIVKAAQARNNCSTCGHSCYSNCMDSCEGSCYRNCGSGCVSSCFKNCESSCTARCTGNCKGDCMGGCLTSCQGGCERSSR